MYQSSKDTRSQYGNGDKDGLTTTEKIMILASVADDYEADYGFIAIVELSELELGRGMIERANATAIKHFFRDKDASRLSWDDERDVGLYEEYNNEAESIRTLFEVVDEIESMMMNLRHVNQLIRSDIYSELIFNKACNSSVEFIENALGIHLTLEGFADKEKWTKYIEDSYGHGEAVNGLLELIIGLAMTDKSINRPFFYYEVEGRWSNFLCPSNEQISSLTELIHHHASSFGEVVTITKES